MLVCFHCAQTTGIYQFPQTSITRRGMLEIPSRADLINAGELCFPGISLRCFSKFIEFPPSDPTMIGITFAVVIHSFCISNQRS